LISKIWLKYPKKLYTLCGECGFTAKCENLSSCKKLFLKKINYSCRKRLFKYLNHPTITKF